MYDQSLNIYGSAGTQKLELGATDTAGESETYMIKAAVNFNQRACWIVAQLLKPPQPQTFHMYMYMFLCFIYLTF